MGGDQRRHPRVEVGLQVKIRFADFKRFGVVTTKNLSEGGLFIVTAEPKPVGTRVQVVLYPPGIELGLPILGTVVHSVKEGEGGGPAGMGIRFDDLDEDARAAVQRLVAAVVHEAEKESARARPPPPPPRVAGTGPPPPRPRAPEGVERRAEARVPARSVVRLRFSDSQLYREFYTKDLSRGGVFVRARTPLPVGTEVELALTPPQGGEPIRLEGRVAHVVLPTDDSDERAGMGIEFTGLTSEKRAEVARYVERTGELLGRVKPMPTAQIHYDSAEAFERAVRSDLRRRRLFVESDQARPAGATVRVRLHAPQLEAPLELHGEVLNAGAEEGGRRGMELRLVDLTDERLADVELRLSRQGPAGPASAGPKAVARPAASKLGGGKGSPKVTGKAAMLAEAALEDLEAGRRASAIANLKLALTFDPGNAYCRELLDKIVAEKK